MGGLFAKLTSPQAPPPFWETLNFWLSVVIALAIVGMLYGAMKEDVDSSAQ